MTKQSNADLNGASRIVSNVLTGWVSYLVMFVIGFFLPRYIDHKLGQELLGIWDFSWSIANYFSLASLGVGSSLNRFIAKYRSESDFGSITMAVTSVSMLQLVLALVVLVSALGMFFGVPLFFADKFSSEQVGIAQNVVLLLGASIAFQFVFDTSRGVLTGCHRWDLFNGLATISYLLTALFMCLVLYLGYGLQEMAFVYMIFTALQGGCRALIARRVCPQAYISLSSYSFDFIKVVFPFGIKTIVIGVSQFLIIQSTYVLVASASGPAALAILARPVSLMKHVETFITRFAYVLTPMAGSMSPEKDPGEFERFVLKCSKFGFGITLPVVVVFALFGHRVIEIWMGEDFVVSWLVPILAIGLLLPISQSPIVRLLVGLNLHGRVAMISLSLTLGLFALGAIIVHMFFGVNTLTAAILISVISTIVNGLVVPFYCCKLMNVSIRKYVRETFMVSGLVGGLVGGASLAFSQIFHGSIFELVNLALYGGGTLLLYWKLLLGNDERAIIKSKFGF